MHLLYGSSQHHINVCSYTRCEEESAQTNARNVKKYKVTMGGDQCQNLQFFLFSTKIICMVKFYIQMTRSLLIACEVLHTNDTLICMVKFYIQMTRSLLFAW